MRNDLIELDVSDKEILDLIYSHVPKDADLNSIDSYELNRVFTIIKGLNDRIVTRLAYNDEFFKALCEHEQLIFHWNKLLNSYDFHDEPHFHIKPQANISSFNLVRAATYEVEIRNKKDEFGKTPEGQKILDVYHEVGKATGDIYFLQWVQHKHIKALSNATSIDSQQNIRGYIAFAQITAQLHGAPGYLLLYLLYGMIGKNYWLMYVDSLERKEYRALSFQYKDLALQCLYTAWFLMPYSQSAINNFAMGGNFYEWFNKYFSPIFISDGDIIARHCLSKVKEPDEEQKKLPWETFFRKNYHTGMSLDDFREMQGAIGQLDGARWHERAMTYIHGNEIDVFRVAACKKKAADQAAPVIIECGKRKMQL